MINESAAKIDIRSLISTIGDTTFLYEEMHKKRNEYQDKSNDKLEPCCSKENKNFLNTDTSNLKNDDVDEDDNRKSFKVPKIYYGSRTHKQIEQVVRELKKTSYKNKRMTILSSREHTCIQDSTINKTQLCNELLDPIKKKGCPYFNDKNRKNMASYSALKRNGITNPWDLEDLVKLGKKIGACPYFAARSLMETAEIIFCPYNYLIDPAIRESLQININQEIIILDEAHNIEDICREVASINIRDDFLHEVIQDCEHLTKKQNIEENDNLYQNIRTYILSLKNLITVQELKEINNYNNELNSIHWKSPEFIKECKKFQLHGDNRTDFVDYCKVAINDYNKMKESLKEYKKDVKPTITQATKIVLEQLIFGLDMIFSDQHNKDYRVFIVESTVQELRQETSNFGFSTGRRVQVRKRIRTLHMMCMNPAVIFAPIAQSARSIILASGTLTPTSTFQTELGTQFPNLLHANHVVPKDQVFIRCIPRGPSGFSLKANYENITQLHVKDEIGKIILNVCQSVPHGVLCFFSSYNVMQQLTDRWKQINIWEELKNIKHIFMEPRNSNLLAEIMQNYRNVIEVTSNESLSSVTGALMLAVFRGKIAEGIDFSDNEARCVITIGIPYTVRHLPSISLKLEYNNTYCDKGLLSGAEWYSVQAFRALNQALGRCIRHKNDWGAILLIDDRFLNVINFNYLPKWIKSMWSIKTEYKIKEELELFVQQQRDREKINEELENLETH